MTFPFFRSCCEASEYDGYDADANIDNPLVSLPLEVLLHILEYTVPKPNERWKWICAVG